MPNLGQFGLGQPNAQDALQQAIQARSQGTSVPQLNQTMQGSPQPGQAPTTAAVPQVGGAPTGGEPKAPTSESELIVKALDQRLRAISKVEEANLAPALAPAQGGGGMNKEMMTKPDMMKMMMEMMMKKRM